MPKPSLASLEERNNASCPLRCFFVKIRQKIKEPTWNVKRLNLSILTLKIPLFQEKKIRQITHRKFVKYEKSAKKFAFLHKNLTSKNNLLEITQLTQILIFFCIFLQKFFFIFVNFFVNHQNEFPWPFYLSILYWFRPWTTGFSKSRHAIWDRRHGAWPNPA